VHTDVGATVPTGENDHLGVGEIRDGVQGDVLHGVYACERQHADEENHQDLIVSAEFDDAIDHFEPYV
jgi:hypothetical protein